MNDWYRCSSLHGVYYRNLSNIYQKACFQQVPAVLCMAETGPVADMDSAAGCSNNSAGSMQGSDASQPRIPDLSMRMHRVQAWLVSNNATWSSVFPQDLESSEGECDAQAEEVSQGHACAAPAQQGADNAAALKPIAGKEREAVAASQHACAAPAQQSPENATAQKPIAGKEHEAVTASQQPKGLHQLSSDQCTIGQQHVMKESADQSASSTVAGVASQQVSGAAAAMHRSAVHALVQRFEHMTVARLKASKPGDAGPGLLASALSDKASQQCLPEVQMHAMPERAPNAATANDESCGDRLMPSRQPQPSCTAGEEEARRLQRAASHGMPCVDCSPVCQPPEWRLNTAFEVESSSAEQAESEPALTKYIEQAVPGGTSIGHTAAQLWPEGLAGAVDAKEGSVQRSGRASPRYAVRSHAPATTAHAYCFCHCYCHCYCDCPSQRYCCYCRTLGVPVVGP